MVTVLESCGGELRLAFMQAGRVLPALLQVCCTLLCAHVLQAMRSTPTRRAQHRCVWWGRVCS